MKDDSKVLKPARPGLIIRDPLTHKPLAEDGERKPWYGRGGTYWRRRVRDSDVVEVLQEKVAPKKTQKGDK